MVSFPYLLVFYGKHCYHTPSESLLGITVSLIFVAVLVSAVIRSGGCFVFVSTTWDEAACPGVLGIVYVDSASKRGLFVVVLGSRPQRYFSLVLRSGCWWAGKFDIISNFCILLSIFWCCATDFSLLCLFTDWPCLWQRSVHPLLPHRRRNVEDQQHQ